VTCRMNHLARTKAHLAAGLTVREAAARLKVGKTALYKALNGSTGAIGG
jgi:transposase